ncbi:hypothetical protein [Bryobacter aggregatus]|uniref:hypothetical protein n=1 Tax=Bryobacter aggregatus TaxID=360054 RepID=UPI0004E20F4F|nr:hypothetical protein [Bryobacter aggregatus]
MSFIQKRFKKQRTEDLDPYSLIVRNCLKHCSICGSDAFADHHYAQLASVVIPSGIDIESLLAMAERGEWQELGQLAPWDATSDNLTWMVIRCGSRGMFVMTLFDPFEPYDDLRSLSQRPVENTEKLVWTEHALLEVRWNPLFSPS